MTHPSGAVYTFIIMLITCARDVVTAITSCAVIFSVREKLRATLGAVLASSMLLRKVEDE